MKDEKRKTSLKKKEEQKVPENLLPPQIPLGAPLTTNHPIPSVANLPQSSGEATDYTNKILNAAIKKYKDVVESDVAEFREDIGSLQHITSEFLDDFIIIGHTANKQRVVIRYARSPKDLDGLMQLSKKVLMRMIVEEETNNF